MKSILVIRPGAIGDALLTFPILEALREQYGDTCITLVSNAQVLPLAQSFGVADETFDFQDILWSELFSSNGIRTSFMRDLLAQTDLAICWMCDPDGIIEHNLKTSGIKHLIIAPGRPPAGEHLHIVDYLARTIGLPNVEAQFIALNSRQPEESPSTSVEARVDEGRLGGPLWSPVGGAYGPFIDQPTASSDQWLATRRFIAIHPGSGAAEKCWPTSRFAEVIKRLWKQNLSVILLSGPADTERVAELLKLLSPSPTSEMFKLLAHAPLLEVAQHLQQCRCYLGNDSGITHLAAMLGIPTVATFGPTDPQIWRPVGPFVKVLQENTLEDVTVNQTLASLDV
jgi:glycosyl transferase family 9 (putative heptosyltransferase)